jgi:hypothetical protein
VAVTPVEESDLEAVIAFEQFQDSKTALNIAKWLKTSHTKAGLKPEYIMCHATDGAMQLQCRKEAYWHDGPNPLHSYLGIPSHNTSSNHRKPRL